MHHLKPWSLLSLVIVAPGLSPAEEAPKDKTASVEQIVEKARDSIVQVTFTGRDGKREGLGTGFIISSDGLIATNLHVIGEARPISVEFADKRRLPVTSVHASDRGLDLAIIKVDAKDLPYLQLGDSEKAKEGQPIVVMGNPHGLKRSVVAGVISGQREIDDRPMLQLAMPIEPGNSGGPVLDMEGRVLGVVTLKSLVTKNLGFAVAVDQLKPLLTRPNPIPISNWLTIGRLDSRRWTPLFVGSWRQRSGQIVASGVGSDLIGKRTLCLSNAKPLPLPYEVAVNVRLDDESGAAGLVFHSDGDEKHYGFYPSRGRLRLSRFEGPSVFQWQVLKEISTEHYQPGDWNHLKVRFEKDRFLCYVNDHLVAESKDKILPSGKLGLAKFREPAAKFKQFRVAPQVAPAFVDEKTRAAVLADIAKLPDLSSMRAADMQPLIDNATTGVDVIRDQAAELEAKAKELRKVAADLHMRRVLNELDAQVSGEDESKIDLLRAALLIAQLDNEDLEPDVYLATVEDMAVDIRKLAKKGDEQSRFAGLNKYLFEQNGFHGSRTNYYHRANSYLNQVIDDREGLPISLSLLYIELGRRVDLNIEGVGLPGHFVARFVPKKGKPQLVDPFERGKLLSRADAAKLVRDHAGRELVDEDLATTTPRQILVRMLRNLLGIAEGKRDKDAMLRYVEAMLVIEPELVQQRGLRALLRFDTGRHEAAIADLDWFLEEQPEGIDVEQIRAMRRAFEARRKQP